jgi:predicted RNase H-like HicB family nuclease
VRFEIALISCTQPLGGVRRSQNKAQAMTNYQFTVVIEPDEDQFHAYAPSLPGCHSFGSTVDEARASIAEAIELYIEGLQDEGDEIS